MRRRSLGGVCVGLAVGLVLGSLATARSQTQPRGLDRSKVYWVTNAPASAPPVGRVFRANPDGTEVELIAEHEGSVGAVAVYPGALGAWCPGDFDRDEDVDLLDFAEFQMAYSGP